MSEIAAKNQQKKNDRNLFTFPKAVERISIVTNPGKIKTPAENQLVLTVSNNEGYCRKYADEIASLDAKNEVIVINQHDIWYAPAMFICLDGEKTLSLSWKSENMHTIFISMWEEAGDSLEFKDQLVSQETISPVLFQLPAGKHYVAICFSGQREMTAKFYDIRLEEVE